MSASPSSIEAHPSRSASCNDYDEDYGDYDDYGDFGLLPRGAGGGGCGGGGGKAKKRWDKRGGGAPRSSGGGGVYSAKHIRLIEARRDGGRNGRGRAATGPTEAKAET
jgi:hypothetical protein